MNAQLSGITNASLSFPLPLSLKKKNINQSIKVGTWAEKPARDRRAEGSLSPRFKPHLKRSLL